MSNRNDFCFFFFLNVSVYFALIIGCRHLAYQGLLSVYLRYSMLSLVFPNMSSVLLFEIVVYQKISVVHMG